MRISDWSSDVCSSDLDALHLVAGAACVQQQVGAFARQPQGGGPADAPRGAGDESGLSGQKAIAFLWHDSAKLPLDGGRENDRPGQHRQLLTLCDENEIVCRLIPRLQRSGDTPERQDPRTRWVRLTRPARRQPATEKRSPKALPAYSPP